MTDPVLRRFTRRRPLPAPVAAALALCNDESVEGLVIDEQPQGLGLVLRGRHAQLLLEHRECCVGATVRFGLRTTDGPFRLLPVRLVRVTEAGAGGRRVRAGVVVRLDRMRPADVEHLLAVWHRFQGRGGR